MPTQAMIFEHFMMLGLARRRQGKHLAATDEFKCAMSVAVTDEQRARATQAMGIDFRLAGDYQEAEFSFDKALLFSRKIFKLKGIILRDFAMLHLDRNEFSLAEAKLAQSIKILDGLDEVEKAVSEGFLGDLYREQGKLALALEFLEHSYRHIKGQNDVYEMNHLIRRLKALKPRTRLNKLPGPRHSAAKTLHYERFIEAALITLMGPRLSDKVKNIRRGH